MRLTFLIATRDRRDSLKRCLDSIDAQRYEDRETIVVVDGSTDGTGEMLAAEHPQVRCIVLPERSGIGFAYSRGLEEATGDAIVNLDDDCMLTAPDAADAIVEGFDAPGVSALCFKVEAPDGTVRRREIPLRSKRMPQTDTDIGYYLGGAVALRRDCLEAVGGYAKEIGYGGIELPTSFRLFKKGGRIVFKPGIPVVHFAIPSEQNTSSRQPNHVRTAIRISAGFLPAPYAQVHTVLWIAQCLVLSVREGSFGATLRAVLSALGRWGAVRREDVRWRLTIAETRLLSALSGRTWY